MIKIDDKSCGFVGNNSDLNAEYSQLTMKFIEAKVEAGMPFQDAVEEIVTATQYAVEWHVDNGNFSLDWEQLKKDHVRTRVATMLFSLAKDSDVIKDLVSKLTENDDEEEEEDDG